MVSNGALLRLVRENPTLTRPAYLQADLERIFEEELYADFAGLWLAIHASRLAPVSGKPVNCILGDLGARKHRKLANARLSIYATA